MRFCSKTACDREAAATCGFDYAERLVWLGPLDDERHPACYDLCEEHAQGLRVPVGWEKEDRRPADVVASPGGIPDAPPPSIRAEGIDRVERGSVDPPNQRLGRRVEGRPAAQAAQAVAASSLPASPNGSPPAQPSLLI